MLKKISHILLAMLLLVTTMGMTVSKHFCGDDLKSISLFTEAESCCDIPTGCCHDELVTVDIQDDFSASVFHFNFEQLAIILPIAIQLVDEEMLQNYPSVVFYETPAPPLLQTVLSNLQTYLL